MAEPFTRRQGEYLAFIHLYTHLHGVPPAEAEIGAHLVVSPPAVHQMLDTVERRGLIERTPHQARSIRVRVPPESLPDIAAGPSAPAPLFSAMFPAIAAWLRLDGWIELGYQMHTGTVARAGDEGGMVWSGGDSEQGPDAWLDDLERGVGDFMDEHGFR